MLVIISDLHLTDGTSGSTISHRAFRVLRQRLSDLAYDASWRSDEEYKPIEELNLILLGDILDVIRSATWLKTKKLRPWSNSSTKAYRDKVAQINRDILKENNESFQVLREMVEEGGLTIPQATNGNSPDFEAERRGVRVNIYYLVGNHDWFYHLPGAGYDQIRQSVIDAMGLANPADEPFPHDPKEPTAIAQKILELYSQHRVYALHGDIYDDFNYEEANGRGASSLGDAIVVELLNRFPKQVEDKLGDRLPKATLTGLREIDNVRPLTVIPAWIQGLLQQTVRDASMARAVKEVWDGMVDEFLEVPFVRQHDRWGLDRVDALEAGLKVSKGLSFGSLTRLAVRTMSNLGSREESYSKHALQEPAFRSNRADYIIYGHTHFQEIVPLDRISAGDRISRQYYFNSGTWRRVFRLAQYAPDQLEFLDYSVMTYLAFFKENERKGRPFESWTGTLGVDPSERGA